MDADEREDLEGPPETEAAEAPHIAPDADGPERQVRPRKRRARPRKRSSAWIALVLLLASIYVFWILPYQTGSRPVRVEFSQDTK